MKRILPSLALTLAVLTAGCTLHVIVPCEVTRPAPCPTPLGPYRAPGIFAPETLRTQPYWHGKTLHIPQPHPDDTAYGRIGQRGYIVLDSPKVYLGDSVKVTGHGG